MGFRRMRNLSGNDLVPRGNVNNCTLGKRWHAIHIQIHDIFRSLKVRSH